MKTNGKFFDNYISPKLEGMISSMREELSVDVLKNIRKNLAMLLHMSTGSSFANDISRLGSELSNREDLENLINKLKHAYEHSRQVSENLKNNMQDIATIHQIKMLNNMVDALAIVDRMINRLE
ncbi:MAG: hypothetical protein N3C61_03275 [Candidatus Micrarchaeota archaeon]|nr:hypothetical protein [Candidatus Micrarchaeota archaeon]